jgi:hypothetical protein
MSSFPNLFIRQSISEGIRKVRRLTVTIRSGTGPASSAHSVTHCLPTPVLYIYVLLIGIKFLFHLSLSIPVAVRSKSVGLRPFACWDCGFKSHRGHGCLSLVSVVCCQVELSATGWSLVQRSPTECDTEASTMRRPWPTRGCSAMFLVTWLSQQPKLTF